jgi:diacylglycerol kinase family enzyme
MKPIIAVIYFATMVSAIAQTNMAPLPNVIIIYSTNQFAPVTVIQTDELSLHENYKTQQSVISNLQVTCMSAKSITITPEGEKVLVVLHGVTMYLPKVAYGGYGKDQKLQTAVAEELTLTLIQGMRIQVNGEILPTISFSNKFKAIPEQSIK